MEVISSDNWKKIWSNRKTDYRQLESKDIETVFMELKRLTGNDTLGKGGVSYESFINQYEHIKLDLTKNGRVEIDSVFEVGCGSAPFLMLFEKGRKKVGGLDYSPSLIETADIVLENPVELYCDEAINIKTEIKYDAVFSNSAFEYFKDYEYAKQVLDKMIEKAHYSVGVLDVHDDDKRDDYLNYRRSIIEDYDKKYDGLEKLFYPKDFFIEYAKERDIEIVIKESSLEGYWNKPFVFDVYFYKKQA